jgi:hypothetical protein
MSTVTKRRGYILVDGKSSHRLLYQEQYGPIPSDWVVHHLNAKHDDNRLENLMALPNSFHGHLHYLQQTLCRRLSRQFIECLLTEWLAGRSLQSMFFTYEGNRWARVYRNEWKVAKATKCLRKIDSKRASTLNTQKSA